MTARRDKVRVSAFVAVSPADAFEVFTAEIDSWWRRGRAYRRTGGGGVLRFEADRLIETNEGEPAHELGRVLVWEPGTRLVFTWRAAAFAPDESTEVEVTFAPRAGGTEVTLEHRGWAAIRDAHPVRHGEPDARFNAQLGRWWGALVGSYRERIASPDPAA